MLNELAKVIHEAAVEKGFYENPLSALELIALCGTELTEAIEELRSGHEPDELYYPNDNKPEGVLVELADCIIRILDMCGYYGIDIDRAVTEKMAYNRRRPHKHGRVM